jgi:hypothetical protein
MTKDRIQITFKTDVSMEDAEGTLHLAKLAAQSLHGPERLELEAPWQVDAVRGTVTIDAATEAGRTLALVFLGYARREFGRDAVRVRRGVRRRRRDRQEVLS